MNDRFREDGPEVRTVRRHGGGYLGTFVLAETATLTGAVGEFMARHDLAAGIVFGAGEIATIGLGYLLHRRNQANIETLPAPVHNRID